jgi:hypothetical protein
MRYLYVLSLMGETLAVRMKERGVPSSEVETWLLYWEKEVSSVARAAPGTVGDIGKRLVTAIKVWEFYIRKAGDE